MARLLILDDMHARHAVLARRFPDAERVHVHTFAEAVDALATGRFDLVLLDHDLGEERTGYHVALAIAELAAEWRPTEAVIHSHNPSGAERMRDVLTAAGVRARLEPFSSHVATETAPPAQPALAWRERVGVLLDACRALPEELGLESLVANLRAAGASKIDTIYVLHRLRGLDVAAGKAVVDDSETWSDRRAADAVLPGQLEALIEAIQEEQRGGVRRRS